MTRSWQVFLEARTDETETEFWPGASFFFRRWITLFVRVAADGSGKLSVFGFGCMVLAAGRLTARDYCPWFQFAQLTEGT